MATVYAARDPNAELRVAQNSTVTVNGTLIPIADIARELQYHEAPTPLAAWRAATRALVVRELLLQEARRMALTAAPRVVEEECRESDSEALVRTLIEQEVETPVADETACRRYYEGNIARFRSAPVYEAAHIMLPAAADDAASRASARATAKLLLAILIEDPGAFARLAAQHSACPSAGTGGRLGQLEPGDTVPEFDEALASLPIGRIALEPVESRYGLHIVRLDRRIEGRQLPFELVRDRIAAYIGERSRRQATAQYLALLASRARIEGAQLPTPADVGAI
jgi:peptidyl-prolyl cis-trans isomerase C